MPWRTLCGFPPTADNVTLRVPNGAWRPDTVITDWDGNEMFVLLDQSNEMRSYEAVFGDLMGRRLVCVKRHLTKAFWKDGYYFCTYKPNYKGQKALPEKDVDKKKVYPFSYIEIIPMKGLFYYRHFDNKGKPGKARMIAHNPWLGYMMVCCTTVIRCGKFRGQFKKGRGGRGGRGKVTTLTVDQWRNVVDVGPGNDLLAALCIAYIFDRCQTQPMITVFGREEDDLTPDDISLASDDEDDDENKKKKVDIENMPKDNKRGGFKDDPNDDDDDYHHHHPDEEEYYAANNQPEYNAEYDDANGQPYYYDGAQQQELPEQHPDSQYPDQDGYYGNEPLPHPDDPYRQPLPGPEQPAGLQTVDEVDEELVSLTSRRSMQQPQPQPYSEDDDRKMPATANTRDEVPFPEEASTTSSKRSKKKTGGGPGDPYVTDGSDILDDREIV